jgi:hypothetical protein
VPFVLADDGIQLFQQSDKITIVYAYDHLVRRVRMNQPHPAQVTPSWYGDSVGHYEGDVLVIDTVGVKTGPLAHVDWFGTPFTHALHVVERYRLIDYEAAREGQIRGLKEWFRPVGDSGLFIDPDYRGRGLQLHFTVEDEGVFTTPWSAMVTYRRGLPVWRNMSVPRACEQPTSQKTVPFPMQTSRISKRGGPQSSGNFSGEESSGKH